MKSEQKDVLIVGAGPSGLAAALELKKLGVSSVAVLEREAESGGIPRLCHHVGFGLQDLHRIYSGPQYARRYRQLAQDIGVEIRTSTSVTGWHGPTGLTYTAPSGIGTIDAKSILLATGCRERPRAARLIPGPRLQGIFTTGSLQRFIDEHQLPVGRRVMIVGAELVSLSAFLTLAQARLDVAMMITEFPMHQIYFPFVPMKWLMLDLLKRTPLRMSTRINKILGKNRVEGVEIVNLDTLQLEMVVCDAVVFTGNWIPEHEVARSGELIIDNGTSGPQVDMDFHTSKIGVFAAGNLMRGAETADKCALEGRSASHRIHHFLQHNTWPESRIPIQLEPPLTWVFPNSVSAPGEPSSTSYLTFRVNKFCQNALLCIYQGDKVLYRKTFRHLLPNQSMRLSSNWLAKVEVNGEILRMALTG